MAWQIKLLVILRGVLGAVGRMTLVVDDIEVAALLTVLKLNFHFGNATLARL